MPPGAAVALVPDVAKTLPGAENAGKPGYYTVKPGDTMIRIGLESGQNWKDLVKWNNLDNPNVIEVGQVLRVMPPGSDSGVAVRPVTAARVEARPLEAVRPRRRPVHRLQRPLPHGGDAAAHARRTGCRGCGNAVRASRR